MSVINNSKWWCHLLTAKGRASRLEYVLVLLVVWLPVIILFWMTATNKLRMSSLGDSFMGWFAAYLIVAIYLSLVAAIRRNHDLGRAGLKKDTTFSSAFSGSEFVFRKGQPGVNKYGSDPCMKYEDQFE